MIIKKSSAEIDLMRKAGQLVARAHEAVTAKVAPGVSTYDLDQIAEDVIRSDGGIPSFMGYPHSGENDFPATLCTSVNHEIVHGIPSKDVVLKEGDLLKVDCGAIIEGFHGDSAMTHIVGGPDAVSADVRAMVEGTEKALWEGIKQATHGNKLGTLGAAVAAVAEEAGWGIVREYVGHGIGRSLHEQPSVPNYGEPGKGYKLSKGLVIAIEPMFNIGGDETETLDDGWTVVTADKTMSAHWEHTVAITAEGPEVLTARSYENAFPLK